MSFYQVLNRVRERAFGDSSENYEGLSKDAFRAAVLQERYLEFPIEGHRWFDLVRTGTFIKPKEYLISIPFHLQGSYNAFLNSRLYVYHFP